MIPSGLFTSCAILADISPSAASRSVCTNCCWRRAELFVGRLLPLVQTGVLDSHRDLIPQDRKELDIVLGERPAGDLVRQQEQSDQSGLVDERHDHAGLEVAAGPSLPGGNEISLRGRR